MGHEKEIITAYQILLTSLSFKKNFTFHFDNINNNNFINNNNDNDKKINNNEYNSNWKKQRVEQLGGISNLILTWFMVQVWSGPTVVLSRPKS